MKRLSATLFPQVLVAVTAVGIAAAGIAVASASSAWAQGGGARARGKAVKRGKQPKQPKLDVAEEKRVMEGTALKAAVVAATNLGTVTDSAALDALLDGLALGLHPRVAAAALDSVARHGDIRAYDTVRFYLGYRDPQVRAAAVRAVGSFDDPRAIGPILAALTDTDQGVRKAAVDLVAARKIRRGIEPTLELLEKGDDATVLALAALATPDLAKSLGELIGVAPDPLLARTLGLIVRKPDFGPETARVQVVRTLAKVPGREAVAQLTAYVNETPEKPPRQSRREAQAIIRSRKSGTPAGGGE